MLTVNCSLAKNVCYGCDVLSFSVLGLILSSIVNPKKYIPDLDPTSESSGFDPYYFKAI